MYCPRLIIILGPRNTISTRIFRPGATARLNPTAFSWVFVGFWARRVTVWPVYANFLTTVNNGGGLLPCRAFRTAQLADVSINRFERVRIFRKSNDHGIWNITDGYSACSRRAHIKQPTKKKKKKTVPKKPDVAPRYTSGLFSECRKTWTPNDFEN